ncbi:MAG: 50S ribosomal protein L17 [Bacteroidetes bacterium]|nr:50S ribosomal protein L17 [Bacteroidota bacterium]
MRHAKVGRRLSRSASHRKALLSALSTALIKHKRIRTTAAKAKETRRIIEPLITRARDAYQREKGGDALDIHSRREIAKFIRDKEALQILFSEIAEKVGKRPGGYTRVLKLGHRLGDGADMAVIELVDYNEAQDSKQRKERAARSKAAAQRRKAAEERKTKDAGAAAAVEAEEAVAETDEVVADVEEAAVQAEDTAADTAEDVKAATDDTVADATDAADEATGEEKKDA